MNETRPLPTSKSGLVVGIAGAIALALALVRYHESMILRETPAVWIGAVMVAVAAALAVVKLRGGALSPSLLGMAAFVVAMTLSGVTELPPWATVDAFGKSPWFAPAMLLIAAGVVIAAGTQRTSKDTSLDATDGALLLFVVFGAFGGSLWIRSADDFAGFLVLFALASYFLAAPGARRRLRDVPFLGLFVLFTAASLAALVTAVDRDRHLSGCLRVLAAGLPLVLLPLGALDLTRATRLLRAFAVMVVVGFSLASIAVFEAGYHFRLGKALQAQLTLFGEHPNIVAPYFAIAPPLLLALWFQARSIIGRAAIVAALLASIGGLTLTDSRAATGAAVLGVVAFGALGAMVWVYRRRPSAGTAAAIAVVTLAVMAGGWVATKGRVAAELDKPSMQYRTYLWDTAARAIEDRPMLGYGYLTGDPLMAHAEYSDLDGRTKDTHPHMLWLAITMGAGAPAAVLFVVLILAFALRVLWAATRLPERGPRALAIGVVASAVALLAANTLDQGLSLHAPFPFHLGLLIGIGSLIVLVARGATDEATATAPRWPAPLLATAFVVTLAALIADRAAARAGIYERRDDDPRALAAARLARRMNPLSRDHAVLEAKYLAATNDVVGALERLQSAAAAHPMSALVWDRISGLEVERREYKKALSALQTAQSLDPTGPLASTWKLREGEIYIQVGNQIKAEQAYADGICYDYEAAHRIPWRWSNTDVREYYIHGANKPIFLVQLLGANRERMPQVVKDNPVRGRRLATTLVKTLMRYHRFATAQKVIHEYRAIADAEWLPLTMLELELQRLWDPETNTIRREVLKQAGIDPQAIALPKQDDASDGADKPSQPEAAPPPITSFEGERGNATLYIAAGERLLTDGKPTEAMAEFERAVDSVYDMVAERHYLSRLTDDQLKAHRDLHDPAGAERAARAALYFNATPNLRVERLAWLAEILVDHGDGDGAVAALERAADLLPRVGARRGEAIVRPFAVALSKMKREGAEAGLAAQADAILARAADTPPGALLNAYTLFELGREREGQIKLGEAQRRFPDWFLDLEPIRRGPAVGGAPPPGG